MIKFETPRYGWLLITITDDEDTSREFKFDASYLTDVPGDMLLAAITSIETGLPFAIELDGEEVGYATLINSPYKGDLMLIGGDEPFIVRNEYPVELAKNVLNYIESNIEEVYKWLSYEDEPEEMEKYRNMIDERVEKLRNLLKEEE